MSNVRVTNIHENEVEWRSEQEAWNNRSEFFVELYDKQERAAQVTNFIDFLKKHNLLPVPGGRTLDVGCGVGDYSLGLAKLGYQATGIDLSNGMIAGARKIAEKEDLDLDLYVGPWSETTREELGWERQFDLSYSFFCPVMFDMNNIEALTKTSRNACLFVGFAGRQDTIVDALYEHFYGQKDDFKWQANVDDVIATVKKVGQDVAVEYVNVPEVEFFTEEEALRYFTMRLHSEEWGTEEAMRAEILPLLAPYRTEDGRIRNTSEDKVAWVSWRVK